MRSALYVSARLAPCALRSFDRGLVPTRPWSLTLNASMLAVAVVAAGFLRVVAFEAATVDAFAISASLFLIVTSSIVLGTVRKLAHPARWHPQPQTQTTRRNAPLSIYKRRPSQALPLALNKARIDAAHASTSIQVIMDVLGVLITCTVAPLVFENAERIFA